MASQSRELFKRLARDPYWECFFLGAQFFGQPVHVRHDDNTLYGRRADGSYLLLPTGNQPYGQDILVPYLKYFKPDVFWCLLDSFMLYPWITGMDLSPTKFLMYFPADGYPFPAGCDRVLQKANVRVAMSKYAQAQAVDMGFADTLYLPHGVDTKKYHPMPNKEELRVKWSQRLGYDLRGKFIVGCVARFQGRKAMPELLKAFEIFAQKAPNAVLLLHCDPWDPHGGNDLQYLLRLRHIEHRTVFTGTRWFLGLSEEELNEIYNLMDVHATSTTGEGFGIPIIESQACGVPNVHPDYTVMDELLTQPKTGIATPLATTVTGTWGVERGMPNVQALADAFTQLYKDENTRRDMSSRCRANVMQYDWDTRIFPAWNKLLKSMVD